MNKHNQARPQNDGVGIDLDTLNLPLPRIIRFYDDFSDKHRTIRMEDDQWKVVTDGKSCSVDWLVFSLSERIFLKKFFSWSYGCLDPTSVITLLTTVNSHSETVSTWLKYFSNPDTAQVKWETLGYNQLSGTLPALLRAISKFMCEMSLCGWLESASVLSLWPRGLD